MSDPALARVSYLLAAETLDECLNSQGKLPLKKAIQVRTRSATGDWGGLG